MNVSSAAKFFVDAWSYQPPGMWKYLVGVAIIGILAAVVPIICNRYSDSGRRYHEGYLAQRERAAQIANLESEGYKHVAILAPQIASARDVEIRARDAEQQPDGTIIRQAALVYEDAVTRFAFAVLAGHSVWKKGADDHFEGPGDGIPIEDGLSRDYVRQLTAEADRVVCVGLASSEASDNNTRLADNRAFHLCRALFNLNYVDQSRQDIRGLSLGEAPPSDEGAVSLQRSVVIIGVLNSRRVPRPEDIQLSLVQLAQVPGVNFGVYRRTNGGQRATFRDIGRGDYSGAPRDNLQPVQAGSNPLAE